MPRTDFAMATLAALGLAPLLLAGVSQWFAIGQMDVEQGLRIGVIYAAIVLTFFGGARCGLAYNRRARTEMLPELAAGAATVIAAVLSLMLPAVACLCVQVAAFMMLGLWDLIGAERGYVPAWYGRLRGFVTPFAVLGLMAMLVRQAV